MRSFQASDSKRGTRRGSPERFHGASPLLDGGAGRPLIPWLGALFREKPGSPFRGAPYIAFRHIKRKRGAGHGHETGRGGRAGAKAEQARLPAARGTALPDPALPGVQPGGGGARWADGPPASGPAG